MAASTAGTPSTEPHSGFGSDSFRRGARNVARRKAEQTLDNMPIVPEVRMIGGALITIVLIGIVLNEVVTTTAINNSSGPFSQVINDAESTGVAAMGLLVIGLIVVAANAILGRFGGGF